ncbi:hypothetical protein [Bradyrhizobium elkanii]|uniref:hypothetical protein n=1 Tax=Bradyrhizobium elkanii TaxID=29448 RepID=UPI00272DA9DA|nr:hypothetical protein [Bradyrhizobium elkanii]WLA80326.1 hypothetical protein QNJ99_33815 [Bradyrhizobium elkanii]
MPRKQKIAYVEGEPLYNVDIWNHEGDVVKHFRDLTADEVDEIRDQYEDEPWLSVVVEEQ